MWRKGWGDWLGTGEVAPQLKVFRSFKEARKFARSLNLRTWKEWINLAKSGKLPSDLPKNPLHVYRNKGFVSVYDWLGTKKK